MIRKQKQTVIPRNATGKGESVVVRMHPPQLKALDDWISKQKPPFPSRPEAVRRLVEMSLARPVRYPKEIATKAKELASMAIDGLIDPSASADEKADRKRRLIKGPSVFRDVGVDQ
jgi:hypothetical protein